MTKVYVWSLPTRVAHLMLIAGVALGYLASEEESWLTWHAAFGYMVGALLLLRIGWGFLSIPYSRFKDFTFDLEELKAYLFNIFGTKKHYIGHNPASSYAIVAMLILGLLTVLSGMLLYGIQEGLGLFASLNLSYFKEMEGLKTLHALFTNLFLAVIFIHISGVLMDRFIHRTDTLNAMIDGYKRADPNTPSVDLSPFQKFYGVLWIALPFILFGSALSVPNSVLTQSIHQPVSYKSEHPLFYEECTTCHILYPPHLLPDRSWTKMMGTLEDHFGDDASLEKEDTQAILDYLVAHSAQQSSQEAAYKISQSIRKKDIIAITESPYWKRRHQEIDKTIFKQKNIAKASNCKACHGAFESGLLHDKDIAIPKGRP